MDVCRSDINGVRSFRTWASRWYSRETYGSFVLDVIIKNHFRNSRLLGRTSYFRSVFFLAPPQLSGADTGQTGSSNVSGVLRFVVDNGSGSQVGGGFSQCLHPVTLKQISDCHTHAGCHRRQSTTLRSRLRITSIGYLLYRLSYGRGTAIRYTIT